MPIPELGPALPQRGGRFSRWVGQTVLQVMGWDFEGDIPNVPRMVIIAAPHTSNWDFVVGIAMKLALGLDARWIGKHTIFRPPFGPFMRWLGGIPVDRSASQGIVQQMIDIFERNERLVVGMAPEGTRRRVPTWKTGFYRIAQGASVPILPAYFDYARKRLGVADLFYPTGDWAADLQTLRVVYRDKTPKKPELFALPG